MFTDKDDAALYSCPCCGALYLAKTKIRSLKTCSGAGAYEQFMAWDGVLPEGSREPRVDQLTLRIVAESCHCHTGLLHVRTAEDLDKAIELVRATRSHHAGIARRTL